MKIFKLLFTLAVAMLSFSAFAQENANQAIQERLTAFIDLTNQKKYSEAFDMMYPKMFAQVSKQDLVDMTNSMGNDGLSLQIHNPRITSFSAPFQDGDETFVKLHYTGDMSIVIEDGSMYDSFKASHAMLEQFQHTYGMENVKYNPDNKTYSIVTNKTMMAIQQKGGQWYLVEINADQMELMKSLFSEPVINALVISK